MITPTSFWQTTKETIQQCGSAMLLQVVQSTGSSPGRQGFRMVVGSNSQLIGSIGGGIMEHKLVELARHQLEQGRTAPMLKLQIHQTNIAENKSGMICSGEQTIGFYYLDTNDLPLLENIIEIEAKRLPGVLVMNALGLFVMENISVSKSKVFEQENAFAWSYMERIASKPVVYIVGGGHVGLALSQTMHQLDFHVEVIDDREELVTMENNPFADQKHVLPFDRIRPLIEEGEDSYIVIMSFGYRTDKLILQQLENIQTKYIGMMGSQAKVDQLLKELAAEGYSKDFLMHLHAPIGMQVHSKTPAEIAVSIAAEIIKIKNAPTSD